MPVAASGGIVALWLTGNWPRNWLRPVLMASFVAMLGLLPAAVSRGIGSETQKPLAIVVIGGALALVTLPRLLQPALLLLAHRGREQREQAAFELR